MSLRGRSAGLFTLALVIMPVTTSVSTGTQGGSALEHNARLRKRQGKRDITSDGVQPGACPSSSLGSSVAVVDGGEQRGPLVRVAGGRREVVYRDDVFLGHAPALQQPDAHVCRGRGYTHTLMRRRNDQNLMTREACSAAWQGKGAREGGRPRTRASRGALTTWLPLLERADDPGGARVGVAVVDLLLRL